MGVVGNEQKLDGACVKTKMIVTENIRLQIPGVFHCGLTGVKAMDNSQGKVGKLPLPS
jgi:hypothetical protein